MNQNLLLKYISGKASQREKEEVAAWIDADAANLKEFMSLRKSYDALVWQDADELKTGRDKLLSLRTFTMNFEIGLPVQFHFTGTGSELTGKSQRTFSVYPYHCSVSKRHLRTLSGRHIYGLHFYIFLLQSLYQYIT